jgi:NitT/TauT family transport system permease protein
MQRERLEAAMPWLVTFGIFVVWELACLALDIPEFILPRPTRIAVALVDGMGAIWFHAQHTLVTTLIGFGLAIIGGVVLGVFVGSSRLIYRGVYPVLVGFNSIPKAAVVPVLVIWFGIGTVPAIITAFLLAFFPIAVNVATGLATLEPELQDVLRSLGAKRRDIIWKVGLPRSLPYFFASLKIAITLAFVGTVISETVASNQGIGTLMVQASATFKIPLMFAGLVVVAVMGIAMYAAAAIIERRTTGWATRTMDFGIGG